MTTTSTPPTDTLILDVDDPHATPSGQNPKPGDTDGTDGDESDGAEESGGDGSDGADADGTDGSPAGA